MTNEELKKRIEEIIQRNIILKANSDKDYTRYRYISAAKEISDFIQENFVPKGSKCTCSDPPGETKLWCCNNCGQRNEEF